MCVRAGAYAEIECVRVCVCVNDAQVDHISDMPRPITCDAGKKNLYLARAAPTYFLYFTLVKKSPIYKCLNSCLRSSLERFCHNQ